MGTYGIFKYIYEYMYGIYIYMVYMVYSVGIYLYDILSTYN